MDKHQILILITWDSDLFAIEKLKKADKNKYYVWENENVVKKNIS
jgi:hypothetical protein